MSNNKPFQKIVVGKGKHPDLKIFIKQNEKMVMIHYHDKGLLGEKVIKQGYIVNEYEDINQAIINTWNRVRSRIATQVISSSYHPIYVMFAEKEKLFRDWAAKYPDDHLSAYEPFEYVDMFMEDFKEMVKKKYEKLYGDKNENKE